jgi:hypothetical protein
MRIDGAPTLAGCPAQALRAPNRTGSGFTPILHLHQPGTGSVVLDRDQNERHVLKSAHLDIPHGFRKLRHPVRQIQAEFVAGNHQHRQIYSALQELISKMNKVNGDQIAPARNLKLNPDGNIPGPTVDSLLFDPVDSA